MITGGPIAISASARQRGQTRTIAPVTRATVPHHRPGARRHTPMRDDRLAGVIGIDRAVHEACGQRGLAAERNGPTATSRWRSSTPSEDDSGDVDGVRRRRRDLGDDPPDVGRHPRGAAPSAGPSGRSA